MKEVYRAKITIEIVLTENGNITDVRQIGYGEFFLESVSHIIDDICDLIGKSLEKNVFTFLRK